MYLTGVWKWDNVQTMSASHSGPDLGVNWTFKGKMEHPVTLRDTVLHSWSSISPRWRSLGSSKRILGVQWAEKLVLILDLPLTWFDLNQVT